MDIGIIIAILGLLVINVALVGFSYGKITQKVASLNSRASSGEKRVEKQTELARSDRQAWEKRMEGSSHALLPECQGFFNDISAKVNKLDGKVDTLLQLMVDGSKKGGKK